jgi:predicted TPR repeat methyltransferase
LADPLEEADALIEARRPQDAIILLERLHEEGRGGLLLQTMRVRALIAAGRRQQALVVAREAAMLYPSIATAIISLGKALLAAGHLPTAIGEFQRAQRLDPDDIDARFQLGVAWREAGEWEKALDAINAIPPDKAPPGLDMLQAEIGLMSSASRADARYVRHLFDQFSHDYDERMVEKLGYTAPQILRSLAELVGLTRHGFESILDLGCGTGLAGAMFRACAKRLDGVDLSPLMVEKAHERGTYDELRVADIEQILLEEGRAYDLILAADTLVYLGDLGSLFAGVAKRLSLQGAFLFTVERKHGEGFELGPKRRWRHSEAYLRAEAERVDLDVAGLLECHPRTEARQPVEGYAVALVRSARR